VDGWFFELDEYVVEEVLKIVEVGEGEVMVFIVGFV